MVLWDDTTDEVKLQCDICHQVKFTSIFTRLNFNDFDSMMDFIYFKSGFDHREYKGGVWLDICPDCAVGSKNPFTPIEKDIYIVKADKSGNTVSDEYNRMKGMIIDDIVDTVDNDTLNKIVIAVSKPREAGAPINYIPVLQTGDRVKIRSKSSIEKFTYAEGDWKYAYDNLGASGWTLQLCNTIIPVDIDPMYEKLFNGGLPYWLIEYPIFVRTADRESNNKKTSTTEKKAQDKEVITRFKYIEWE